MKITYYELKTHCGDHPIKKYDKKTQVTSKVSISNQTWHKNNYDHCTTSKIFLTIIYRLSFSITFDKKITQLRPKTTNRLNNLICIITHRVPRALVPFCVPPFPGPGHSIRLRHPRLLFRKLKGSAHQGLGFPPDDSSAG